MAVRLITAAVGIAVGIGVLFLSDTMFFYIVLATISLFIIHELFNLKSISSTINSRTHTV